MGLYIWRVWPRIDKGEQDHYICALREPVDEEFVQQNFGSGRYLVLLKDARRKLIRQHVFSVNHPEFPPRLDEAEVLHVPENDTYFKVWAKKPNSTKPDGERSRKDDVAEVLRAHNEGAQAEHAAYQTTADARDKLAIKLAELNAQNSTIDWPQVILAIKNIVPAADPMAIVDRILAAQKPNDPHSDAISTLITAQSEQAKTAVAAAAEQRKTDLEYVRLLVDSKVPPAEDSFAKFQQVFGFAKDLIDTYSRASGGRRNGWDIALDAGREFLLPTIQTVGGLIAQSMALRHGQAVPGNPAAPAMPAAWNPYADQRATQAYAQSLRQQQQAPQPTSQHTQSAPPSSPQPAAPPAGAPPAPPDAQPDSRTQILQLLQLYGNLVLQSMNMGDSGDVFADNLVRFAGAQNHALICQHGEEALASTMLTVPEFSMFGEQKVRRFVWEFCHYEELAGEDEDEGEDRDEVKATAARGRA